MLNMKINIKKYEDHLPALPLTKFDVTIKSNDKDLITEIEYEFCNYTRSVFGFKNGVLKIENDNIISYFVVCYQT